MRFQSPELLTDLYRDLRDRRLLPLVLVLVVGMVVVPMALKSKPESTPAVPPLPAAAAAKKSNAPDTTVVVSNPGVRDYKRRLKGDVPEDPFVVPAFAHISQPSGVSTSSSSSTSGSGSTGTTTSSPTSSGSTTPTGSGSTTPTGGSASQPVTQSKFFFYRSKLRTGQIGEKMKVLDSVDSLTPIPSKQVPALEYLGVTMDSKFRPTNAVFLVSTSVSTIDGTGNCTFAGTFCQILSLKPGEHEDVVWTDGLLYRVNLVKFDLIVHKQPPSVSGQGSSGGGSNGRSAGPGGFPGRHFSF